MSYISIIGPAGTSHIEVTEGKVSTTDAWEIYSLSWLFDWTDKYGVPRWDVCMVIDILAETAQTGHLPDDLSAFEKFPPTTQFTVNGKVIIGPGA